MKLNRSEKETSVLGILAYHNDSAACLVHDGKEDIPVLVDHFMGPYSQQYNKKVLPCQPFYLAEYPSFLFQKNVVFL